MCVCVCVCNINTEHSGRGGRAGAIPSDGTQTLATLDFIGATQPPRWQIYYLHLNARARASSATVLWRMRGGGGGGGGVGGGLGDAVDDGDEVNVLYERNIFSVFAFGCEYVCDILGECV